jgi:hypothetical protein
VVQQRISSRHRDQASVAVISARANESCNLRQVAQKSAWRHHGEHMKEKTKLRIRLEALTKGKQMRLSGVGSSSDPDYRKAVSTVANIRVSTGQKFSLSLGPRALTITRTK